MRLVRLRLTIHCIELYGNTEGPPIFCSFLLKNSRIINKKTVNLQVFLILYYVMVVIYQTYIREELLTKKSFNHQISEIKYVIILIGICV